MTFSLKNKLLLHCFNDVQAHNIQKMIYIFLIPLLFTKHITVKTFQQNHFINCFLHCKILFLRSFVAILFTERLHVGIIKANLL